MKEKKVNKELRERLKDIYEETVSKVKTEGKIRGKSWTVKGLDKGVRSVANCLHCCWRI